jgi:chromosome segregation ATPase
MGENLGMDDSEGLEQRVAAVESEVKLVRREAAAARALAAGADRDVADYRAEMRAHTRGLNALRETQVEHYAEMRAHTSALNALRQTQIEHYAEHKADTAGLKADSAELKAGIAHIVHLLETSEGGPGRRNG